MANICWALCTRKGSWLDQGTQRRKGDTKTNKRQDWISRSFIQLQKYHICYVQEWIFTMTYLYGSLMWTGITKHLISKDQCSRKYRDSQSSFMPLWRGLDQESLFHRREAPGWLSQLSVQLQLRSWSHSLWVRAQCRALCWQLRAWSLLQILCLPLSLPLPCLLSLLSLKNK